MWLTRLFVHRPTLVTVFLALVLLFGAEFTKVYARSHGDAVDVQATLTAA